MLLNENIETENIEIPDFDQEVKELEEVVRQHKNKKDLIAFYGSSSIRLWETMKEDLDPFNIINLGFGGSSYPAMVHYFDQVFEKLEPKQIVIYAGDNDLGHGHNSMRVFNNFIKMVDKIIARYPGIHIHTISIKPSPNRVHLLHKTSETNALMREHILRTKNGKWIEVFGKMLTEDAKTRPELYVEDELHLNELGYDIWRKVVKHHLFANNPII